MELLKLSAEKLAEKIGIKKGTLANKLAGLTKEKRIEIVSELLRGKGYTCKDIVKEGRKLVFILEPEPSTPKSSPLSSPNISAASMEAGSPPPASSFSPKLTDSEKKILNALKEKEKEKVWKKLVVAKDPLSINQKAKKYGLSKSTVARWVNACREKGIVGLIPWKREAVEIPERIRVEAEKLYANSQMPIKTIHDRLLPLMAEVGVYVSYEKLKSYLQELSKNYKYEITRRKYGRSAAMKFTLKIGRWRKPSPFTVWQSDHTQMDNWVVFPNGEVGRPYFSAVIDEATGYILSWKLLQRHPNARTTTFLFIEAIERWGLPEAVRIDNGKDYVSERVLNGFKSLEVEVIRCYPRSPWQKGQVEGLMGIIKKGFCPQLIECYSYRDPKHREALPKEKVKPIPIESYSAKLESYIKDRNAQIAYQKRLTIPEEPVGFNPLAYYYFLEERERTVDRGEIHIDGITYRAKELLNSKWFGEKVICKLDDEDASRMWVFTPKGDFICEAFADGTEYQVPLEVLREEKKRLSRNRRTIARAREEIVKVESQQKARKFQDVRASQENYERINESKKAWEESLREAEKREKTLQVPEVFRGGEVITFLYENRERIGEVPDWVIEKFREVKENPRYSRIYAEEIKAVEEALTSSTKGVK